MIDKSFQSMDDVQLEPPCLPVSWETRMPWGKYQGLTVEQVAGELPKVAYGYFMKLHDVGKIKLDQTCKNLLEDALSDADEEDGYELGG